MEGDLASASRRIVSVRKVTVEPSSKQHYSGVAGPASGLSPLGDPCFADGRPRIRSRGGFRKAPRKEEASHVGLSGRPTSKTWIEGCSPSASPAGRARSPRITPSPPRSVMVPLVPLGWLLGALVWRRGPSRLDWEQVSTWPADRLPAGRSVWFGGRPRFPRLNSRHRQAPTGSAVHLGASGHWRSFVFSSFPRVRLLGVTDFSKQLLCAERLVPTR